MSRLLNPTAIGCLGIFLITSTQALATIPAHNQPKIQGIPLSCHLRVARTLKDKDDIGWMLKELVKNYYAKAGQQRKDEEFLSQVLQVVTTINNTNDRDFVLSKVSGAYTEAGQYSQALQILNVVKADDLRAAILITLASD